ncbi:hypothetical protein AA0X95_05485 [Bacillus sp. 1P10SD]|uniref:hypothetical protein n=1 Tax=Bacillus sp. 1P10SD TaxID=3132265 RepID=UPI0039A6B942
MQMNLNKIRIVEVSKDKIGSYIKLDVQLPDGDCIIRWDLDELTYKNIKEVVSKKHFDSLAIDNRYEIRPYISTYQERPNSQPYFKGVISCIQGNRVARVEFPCSERFAGNMEWFRKEVKKVEDIKHLFWENFLK